jgi:hypothetical protein
VLNIFCPMDKAVAFEVIEEAAIVEATRCKVIALLK